MFCSYVCTCVKNVLSYNKHVNQSALASHPADPGLRREARSAVLPLVPLLAGLLLLAGLPAGLLSLAPVLVPLPVSTDRGNGLVQGHTAVHEQLDHCRYVEFFGEGLCELQQRRQSLGQIEYATSKSALLQIERMTPTFSSA